MANNVIEYIIEVKDNTKKAFTSVSNSLKNLQRKSATTTSAISRNFSRMASRVKRSLSGLSGFMKRVFRGLKLPAILGGTGGLLSGIFGVRSIIKAAAEFESLELRLKAVSGSALEAKKRFEELKDFAAGTPFPLDDLVKAEILLRSIGKGGDETLKTLSSGAIVFNKTVAEMAQGLIGLEAESLKQFGITSTTSGEQRGFRYKNKLNEDVAIVATGIDDARQAFLQVLEEKTGGLLGEASRTLTGRISTLKDNIKSLSSNLGERLLSPLGNAIEQVTTAIQKFQKSDSFKTLRDTLVKYAQIASGSIIGILGDEKSRKETLSDIKLAVIQMFDNAASTAVKLLITAGPFIGKSIGGGIVSAIDEVLPPFVSLNPDSDKSLLNVLAGRLTGKFGLFDNKQQKEATRRAKDVVEERIRAKNKEEGKDPRFFHLPKGEIRKQAKIELQKIIGEEIAASFNTATGAFDRLAERAIDTTVPMPPTGLSVTPTQPVGVGFDAQMAYRPQPVGVGFDAMMAYKPPSTQKPQLSKAFNRQSIGVSDFFDRIQGISSKTRDRGTSISYPSFVHVTNLEKTGVLK